MEIFFGGKEFYGYAQTCRILQEIPGAQAEYTDRDATRTFFRTVRCHLEDGELVRSHPTDLRAGWIRAPLDVRFSIIHPDVIQQEREFC